MPSESPGIKDPLIAIEGARHYIENISNHGTSGHRHGRQSRQRRPDGFRLAVESPIEDFGQEEKRRAQAEYSEDWRDIQSV